MAFFLFIHLYLGYLPDPPHLFRHRQRAVDPMDGEPTALHPSEPGHLALGKLVDGDLQPREHLVVREPAGKILRHELILQPIVEQVVCRNAFIEQRLHLVHHPVFESHLQPAGNLLPAQFTIDVDADDDSIHRRQFAPGRRMLQIIGLDLDGADGPRSGIYVRRVVHVRAVSGFQVCQHLRQFCQRLAFEAVAQRLILGHRRQMIALEHRFDIEPGTATEYRHRSPTYYIIIGIEEVLLILKEVILRAWLADIYQMIGYQAPIDGIVFQVLACADIHPAIHLTGVCRDDLPAYLRCQLCRHGCFPRCRRP